MGLLQKLLRQDQTVFSFPEIALLSGSGDKFAIASQVHYYVKRGDLYHLRRGLYAKDSNYNRLELATKILVPGYVSMESVLAPAGVIFQHYSEIFVASYQSREIVCDNQRFVFKRLKESILTNPQGINITRTYSSASPERALLDILYLNSNYHFDNLGPIDWAKALELLPLYGGKQRMERMVSQLQEEEQASRGP